MPRRDRTIRTPIAILTAVALSAIGARSPAMAAPPNACDVPNIVAHALPAIVNISAVKVLTKNGEDDGASVDAEGKPVASTGTAADTNAEPAGPHFETFVRSGAIINPAGIIITNKHVIKDAAVIKVTFSNKTEAPAQLVAAASLMDLALLKVNMPQPLPTLEFGDSDALRVGQTVIAVGNPLGLGTSVSVGVVSARDRDLMRSPFDEYIQTDATINPGNSGGPMLDCSGRIVGIDTALLSNSTVLGSIGIGFALPSDYAQFVANKLLDLDSIAPNWIGFQLQTLNARLATIFGRPGMQGAIVTGVAPGSPAAEAEIQPGDIIAGADGKELDTASAVMRYVVTRPVKQPISLLLCRNDEMLDLVLRGEPWPHLKALRSAVLASPASVAQAQAAGLGLHLAPMSTAPDIHDARGVGVLVDAVTPESQADAMGIRPGDVLERVDGKAALTPADVVSRLTQGSQADGDLVALLVHSKTSTRWVTLYVGRVEVKGLVAAPALPGGFGSVEEVGDSP